MILSIKGKKVGLADDIFLWYGKKAFSYGVMGAEKNACGNRDQLCAKTMPWHAKNVGREMGEMSLCFLIYSHREGPIG